MKKILLSLLLPVCAIPAFAAPEAMYLVGSMNNWTLPGQASESEIYELKKSGDVYQGSFNIPGEQIEFKVFTSKATMWDRTAYGMESRMNINVFKNKSASTVLVNNEKNGYGANNISISNWKSGTLTVECTVNETDDTVNITLSGPGQPEMPALPSIYVIGEFNNWQLPSASALNGAVSLDLNHEMEPNYSIEFSSTLADIPGGKAKYVYYYKNTVSGNDTFIGGPGAPFSIYDNFGTGGPQFFSDYVSSSHAYADLESARKNPFEIANYTGDQLFFQGSVYVESSDIYRTTVGWNNAPANEMPALNVILEANGVRSIFPTTATSSSIRSWSGGVIGPVDILFTTADSPQQSDAAIWGVQDPLTITVRDSREAKLVASGNAIHLEGNSSPTPIYIKIDYTTHTVSVTTSGFDPTAFENIWVIGYMSGWPSPIAANEDKFPKLNAVEPGVFEGIVDCPAAEEPEFRFKTDLNGWVAEGCLGSGQADFSYETVNFSDKVYRTPIWLDGLGNWRLPDWEKDGQVKMRVDLNNLTLLLTDLSTNAIEEVAEDSALPARYYNLQGQPVEHPAEGLYIRVRGGKSEKVIF